MKDHKDRSTQSSDCRVGSASSSRVANLKRNQGRGRMRSLAAKVAGFYERRTTFFRRRVARLAPDAATSPVKSFAGIEFVRSCSLHSGSSLSSAMQGCARGDYMFSREHEYSHPAGSPIYKAERGIRSRSVGARPSIVSTNMLPDIKRATGTCGL